MLSVRILQRQDKRSELTMYQPRPHNFNEGYLPNGAPGVPGSGPAGSFGSNNFSNNGRVVQNGGVRVLCVADVRGKLKALLRS